MKFIVNTKYDYERLLKFNRYSLRDKKVFWIFMAICNIIVLSIAIPIFCTCGFNVIMFVITLLIFLITLFYAYMHFLMPLSALKKSPLLDAFCICTFKEDYFNVKFSSSKITDKADFKYDVIKKVVLTEQSIYIYVSDKHAYIIDKNGFTTGNCDEFIKFISAKIRKNHLD